MQQMASDTDALQFSCCPSLPRHRFGGILDWILLKIVSQFGIQPRMTSTQRTWLLKESLDRNGEKLGGVSSSVGIEQSRYSGLLCGTERRKLGLHNFAPC